MDSSAPGTIRIERIHQFANRTRRITIWLNGERVGQVRDGAVADFAIAPGPHEVRATIDWCATETIAVSVEPGGGSRCALRQDGRFVTAMQVGDTFIVRP